MAGHGSPTMPRPESIDAGSSTPDVKKRGNEGDDGAKKRRHEQQEECLREYATDLREAVSDLKIILTSYSSEDTKTSNFIRYLSEFCDRGPEVPSRQHQFDAIDLAVRQYPIPLLKENGISKMDPSE